MRLIFIAITIPALALIFAITYVPFVVHASNSVMVNVGGNGSSWSSFTPQSVEIKAGDTVTWRNPMAVSEPHTVSFLKDQSFYPPPSVPVPITFNSTDLKADPDANIDPLTITDQNGTKSVIVDNARHYNPVSVDSSGHNTTYLPLNANYTLTGTEKFVSSGWMWPEGLAPQGAPPIKSFSVTFENAGKYDYLCVVHPWMTGTVIVN
jgi:plastocyanin